MQASTANINIEHWCLGQLSHKSFHRQLKRPSLPIHPHLDLISFPWHLHHEDPHERRRASSLQVQLLRARLASKIATKDCSETLKGGALGGTVGLALGVGGVFAAGARYPAFRQLTLPLRAFLCTSGATFGGTWTPTVVIFCALGIAPCLGNTQTLDPIYTWACLNVQGLQVPQARHVGFSFLPLWPQLLLT